MLQEAGARISAYDPAAMKEAEQKIPNVNWAHSAYDALEGADALVILTEWDEFRTLDLAYAGSRMKNKILCDFRNIYKPQDAARAGFHYSAIGSGSIAAPLQTLNLKLQNFGYTLS